MRGAGREWTARTLRGRAHLLPRGLAGVLGLRGLGLFVRLGLGGLALLGVHERPKEAQAIVGRVELVLAPGLPRSRPVRPPLAPRPAPPAPAPRHPRGGASGEPFARQ